MPVHTVLGPVDLTDLGPTLVHEHVAMADWSMRHAFGERFYQHALVADRAVEHFSRAREAGVRTVVDGTPVNMGRDVGLIREVAERTGLNFVVSSGFYYVEEVYLTWRSEEEVYDLLSRECRDGVADTGVRPGMMKAACADAGITPLLENVFRAVGRVAAEQRLPVFAHHHVAAGTGEAIVDLFEDCGVAPSQVVLGHSGDTDDVDHLERLLARGCYLGLDRFGYCDHDDSFASRVRTVVELCARGHADRLLLSHDLAVFLGVFGSWEDFVAHDHLAHGADFTFVHTQVLPALVEAGLEPGAVAALLEHNPRELFDVGTATTPSAP